MFKRHIIRQLEEWAKNPKRKPLVLRGPRQVGKTTTVNLFAEQFDQYLSLNLELKEDRALFEQDLPFDKFLEALFFTKKKDRSQDKTLLFIDEIQACPAAVTKLRYFYEKVPNLYVIAAGSLLESLIDRQISFPVGRVEYLAVRPVTFYEFLSAIEEIECLTILEHMPFPSYGHDTLLDHFRTYTLIGGMPEVVARYAETRDVQTLKPIFDNLLTAYLDDVEEYTRNPQMGHVIRHTISSSFLYAATRIKFQGFGKSNYASREMGESLRTLERAMLLNLLYPSTSPSPPIQPDQRKSPRLQLLDTGLVNYFAGLQQDYFGTGLLDDLCEGRIAEHIVAQELLGPKTSPRETLHFWVREKKQSNAEVDFIRHYDSRIVPIEVKSGAGGRLRSLHAFMDQCDHHYAIRISSRPFSLDTIRTLSGKRVDLLNLPFYLVGKIDDYIQHWFSGKLPKY